MKSTPKHILLFYSMVGFFSAILILLLVHGINWPIISEAIIGIALFVHSLILARSGKDLFMKAYEKGLVSEWLFHLQHEYDISNSSNREVDS
jgi:cell division protein FtsW (lipid II flippase)